MIIVRNKSYRGANRCSCTKIRDPNHENNISLGAKYTIVEATGDESKLNLRIKTPLEKPMTFR